MTDTGHSDPGPPDGFTPAERSSPYLDLVGPLFQRPSPSGADFGLRLDRRHANSRGLAHGGLVTALSDVVLGYGTLAFHGAPLPMVTSSLTVSFVASAPIGAWLQGSADVKRIGSRQAFASCDITADGILVATASAVFSIVPADRGASGDA